MTEDQHSPRAAQQPRCHLCSQHHQHMSSPHQWKDGESCELAKKMGLDMDSVVCRPCRHDITRLKTTSSYTPRWEKHNKVTLCAVEQCNQKLFCTLKIATSEEITKVLKLKADNSGRATPLCKTHYYEVYHTLQPTKSNCPTCGIPLKKTQCRYCPDPQRIEQHLHDTTDFNGKLEENDMVCYQCYKAHLNILHTRTAESLDSDLVALIDEYQARRASTTITNIEEVQAEACTITTLMVCERLLSNSVLLLSDIYDHFCDTCDKLTYAAQLEKVELKITPMWVLSMISTNLKHHMTWACKTRKHGTIVYRTNSDLIAPLQQAMWKLRQHSKSKHDAQDPEVIQTKETKDQLLSLNTRVHNQIRKHLENKQASSDPQTEFNIDKLVDNIDPELWTAICTLTKSVSESKGTTSDSAAVQHLKKTRRLFILCAILFCTDDRCSYPVHTLITDLIDGQGGSALLVKILNRFGVCASYDTLLRFIQTKVNSDENTPASTLDSTAFTVVSADNIDYLHSYARVYNGKQESSWHGTSIQAVQPNPTLSMVEANCSLSEPPETGNEDTCTQGESTEGVNTVTMVGANSLLQHFSVPPQTANEDTRTQGESTKTTSTVTLRNTSEALKDPYIQYQLLLSGQRQKRKRKAQENMGRIGRARTGTEKPRTRSLISTAHPSPPTHLTTDSTQLPQHDPHCASSPMLNPNATQHSIHDPPSTLTPLHGQPSTAPLPTHHPTAGLPPLHDPPTPSPTHHPTAGLPPLHDPPTPSPTHHPTAGLPPLHDPSRTLPPALTIHDFLLSEHELESLTEIQLEIHGYLLQKTLAEGKIDRPFMSLQEYLNLTRATHTAKSKVAYLEVMAATADSKDTLLDMINNLHEKYIIEQKKEWLVITGDAKVYDILQSLKHEYGDELKWVIPYPGDFHLLMNYQTALMKCYYDAGLKSLAMAAGYPVAAIQSCSQFKRTHKFILEAWEAIYQSMITTFLHSTNSTLNRTPLTEAATALHKLKEDKLTSEVPKRVLEMHKAIQNNNKEFKAFIQKMANQDDTWRFWVRFVFQDVMAYVGLFLGVRSGDWNLRVASLKEMAPLFTAYDHHTYQKLIARHVADLTLMPPQILTMFQQGAFTVNITGRSWHSVGIDEAHEMLINKSCKMSIVKPNPENINRLIKYLPYRSKLLESVQHQLFPEDKVHHPIINSSENLKREANVKAQMSLIDEKDLLCTSLKSNRGLINPFTNKLASPQQNHDLMNGRSIGQQEFLMYASAHIVKIPTVQTSIRKRRLQTFSQRRANKQRINQLERDRRTLLTCFRKKLKWSKTTGKAVEKLNEQLIMLPQALSDHKGVPIKGQKRYMTKFHKRRYQQCSQTFTEEYPRGWSPQCVIYDGMFIINTTPLGSHRTLADYGNFLIKRFVSPHFIRGCTEVHIVFDNPDSIPLSPKLIEQKRRDTAAKIKEDHKCNEFKPETMIKGSWRESVINCRACKRSLVKFLGNYILHHIQSHLSSHQKCFVAGCFDENIANTTWYVHGSNNPQPEPSLTCNAPEADTRVWLHARRTSSQKILVISPDTDTYHIGLALPWITEKQVLVQISPLSSKETLYLNISKFTDTLKGDPDLVGLQENTIPSALQTLFVVTGCDYVSFFSGIGKATFSKNFYQHANFITGPSLKGTLCDTDNHTKNDGFLAFLRLVGTVYFMKHASAFDVNSPHALFKGVNPESSQEDKHYEWLELIRQNIWDRITYENDMIPSTSALWRHWLRSCWVINTWKQADKNVMTLEEPQCCGWKLEGDNLAIDWDSEENMSAVQERVALLTKGCKCRTGCSTLRCSCRKSGNQCSVGCECINCVNVGDESHSQQVTDDLTVDEDICERSNDTTTDDIEDMEDWIFGCSDNDNEFLVEPNDYLDEQP